MNTQYSGKFEQTTDKEKIKAIFEYVGIGSTSKVFDRFVQSDYSRQILENSLFHGGEKTVPRSINYLKWVPMENQMNAKSRMVEFGITCIVGSFRGFPGYAADFYRLAAVSLLESTVRDVRMGYLNGMITIGPSYHSKFRIVAEACSVPPNAYFSSIDTIIDYDFSIPISIPLSIFACWLKGNLEDPSRGIQIEASDDKFLTYEDEKFPTGLYRWANGKGVRALEILLREQFMSKESYDIIKKRISYQMHASNKSSRTNLREPTSYAKGLGYVQPSGYPYGSSLQETRRLAMIVNHEGSVHNYSSWSKLLQYSGKSSVHDFLKKMEEMDLLTVEKTRHGTRIKLTPYGHQRVIGWQTRNNS